MLSPMPNFTVRFWKDVEVVRLLQVATTILCFVSVFCHLYSNMLSINGTDTTSRSSNSGNWLEMTFAQTRATFNSLSGNLSALQFTMLQITVND